jgi:squalene synthase HpnC
MPVSASPSPSLDPRTPPIDLLRLIGPEWERASPELIAPTLDKSLAYCRGLATSHYENFSVLSSLVPLHLRDDFAVVYAFCRWSDDLGDETGSTPEARQRSERLLAWWSAELNRCFTPDSAGGGATHPVYVALRATAARHPHLAPKPFADLIAAFVQDQRVGTAEHPYETWEQVVDYCTRSANPVGRIVLTLGGFAPPEVDPANSKRYAMSDATCTALQLINFWQDVRRDLLERDRVYIPVLGPAGAPTGITRDLLRNWAERPRDPLARVPYIRGVRPLVEATAALFDEGRPLPDTLDRGLSPVVWLFGAGGEAILKAVRGMGCATLWNRPRLAASEKALLVGRAWLRTKFGRSTGG